jgi:hypothetical protein
MAKYRKYDRGPGVKKAPWEIHPIWRGIGCILMLIIPVMAYAGAVMLVEANFTQRWVPVPADLARTISIPMIGAVPNLYANLIVTAILALFGYGIMTIVFSLFYGMVGPPRYGPLDSPPVRERPRRRR